MAMSLKFKNLCIILLPLHTEMMGDIMYLYQALKQDDSVESVKAIMKKVNSNIDEKNWELIV